MREWQNLTPNLFVPSLPPWGLGGGGVVFCFSGADEFMLCNATKDSMEHLFFECAVSGLAWSKVQAECSVCRGAYC